MCTVQAQQWNDDCSQPALTCQAATQKNDDNENFTEKDYLHMQKWTARPHISDWETSRLPVDNSTSDSNVERSKNCHIRLYTDSHLCRLFKLFLKHLTKNVKGPSFGRAVTKEVIYSTLEGV